MKHFIEGRKETFSILQSKIQPEDKVVWFHMASLGEFEQGLPIIEVTKKLYKDHKIVISFFSPSGYENKKNTPVADAVVYLPLDTPANAKKFLDLVHPSLAIFIKYEFWPNYLRELRERNVISILVSGGFRRDQLFFKPYGSWMKTSLKTFDHFFVQNQISKELLNSIGYNNVSISGDTRFDRVAKQLEIDNKIDFIKEFVDGKLCVVAGSTWPEDEILLENFINRSPTIKFIIAPHALNREKLNKFKSKLKHPAVLFSEKEGENLKNKQVFIMDAIGFLTRIYSYADIAYVGGAAGNTGLHNILEAATFGVPIVIGKNFERFPEAIQLQKLAGLYSVANGEELNSIFEKFVNDPHFREKTGMIAGHYVNSNTGATKMVFEYLKEKSLIT